MQVEFHQHCHTSISISHQISSAWCLLTVLLQALTLLTICSDMICSTICYSCGKAFVGPCWACTHDAETSLEQEGWHSGCSVYWVRKDNAYGQKGKVECQSLHYDSPSLLTVLIPSAHVDLRR